MSDYGVFDSIYKGNLWGGRQSRSGTGSDLEETVKIREGIPKLIEVLDVKSVLDIPCGDFNWWKDMKLDVEYIGGDIVDDIIKDNLEKYPGIDFRKLNIVNDKLPKVDLVHVRDLFGHMPNDDVQLAIKNIENSGSRYLLTTHWPTAGDADAPVGGWRPINIGNFLGEPITTLEEDIKDKFLGLWELNNE